MAKVHKSKKKPEIPPQVREAASKALQGNQFWKLRSKHGRDQLFASADLFREAAQQYFQWCDDNPFYESKPMVVSHGMNSGSSVEMVEIPIKRPYTLHGLCIYLGCSTSYFRTYKSTCDKETSKDFLAVLEEVEQAIYEQKFTGAASGFFNANIIARDLGLRDQQDVNVTDNRKSVEELFPDEDEFNTKKES